MVEQWTHKPLVGGSIRSRHSNKSPDYREIFDFPKATINEFDFV